MAADAPDRNEGEHPAGKPDHGLGEREAETQAPEDSEPTAPGRSPAEHGDAPADGDTTPATANPRPYPPALIATAVALPVMLIVGILVAAFIAARAPVEREPIALGPVPAPQADGPACTALLPALPDDIDDYRRAELVAPAPPGTRAWQRDDPATEPIVLRCGLDRPLEFNRASALQIVNNVQWFEIRDPAAAGSTWFAVDRETYLGFTVPDGSGPTPLQAVSDAITATMPERPLDPNPLPN
ncbi:DUF3515 domain-containing protein [Nocardia asteroides]|uniref:DUF3515 domain-containing protein n=1 Tax=Nocardia asteroides TaxID=1824 RepID=UPI001E49977A|nr:DUF3515 domain-containing protein [Nocardia asteroides]UGT63762.1 DUF3515 domain-containing protein [Nocardia asteroides]